MTCYLDRPYKTKKALKEAVAAGKQVTVWGYDRPMQTAIPKDGEHALVGPEPYVRNWYATIVVKDGVITKVKG
jgi:hypothetical protein